MRRSDDGGGAADVHGPAEPVTARAVARCELRELCSGRGVEEVCGAGAKAIVVVKTCSDEDLVAADGDGLAEVVIELTVARCELGELCSSGGVEEVGSAGVCEVAVAFVCPDDRCGVAESAGDAERVIGHAVTRQELDLLRRDEGREEREAEREDEGKLHALILAAARNSGRGAGLAVFSEQGRGWDVGGARSHSDPNGLSRGGEMELSALWK